MKRGPKPVPTPILKMRGSRRVDERADEPKLDSGMPSRPAGVTGEARKEWDRMGKRLLKLGVLTKADGPALAAYCQAWEVHQRVVNELRMAKSLTTQRETRHPLLSTVCQTSNVLNRWLAEFGLTPSSRTRVSRAAPSLAHDDDDDFLDSA